MEKLVFSPGSRSACCAPHLKAALPRSRPRKPPPLHTGADWKVVLHLPEIEKWLRATGDRVTQLAHSVSQDGESRHVDVHLVQLKVRPREPNPRVLFFLKSTFAAKNKSTGAFYCRKRVVLEVPEV